jgi:hypothetical protein
MVKGDVTGLGRVEEMVLPWAGRSGLGWAAMKEGAEASERERKLAL